MSLANSTNRTTPPGVPVLTEEQEAQVLPDNIRPIEKPRPLAQAPRPDDFDIELLPDVLKPFVKERAALLDCPPEMIAVPALVTLGAVFGNRVAIQPKQHDTYTVRPNVWGAVVAAPSSMKSPASDQVLDVLANLEKEAKEDYRIAVEHYQRALYNFSLQQKHHDEAQKKAVRDGGSASPFDESPPEKPTLRRFRTNDGTHEAVHELLSQSANRTGMMVELDELSSLLARMDENPSLRSFYLKAWNGSKSDTIDRVQRGTITVDRLCLSVFGGIQPGKLAPVVKGAVESSDRDDGLLQRFGLLVVPNERETWKCNDTPMNCAGAMEFENALTEAETRLEEETRILFSEGATDLWIEFAESITADARQAPPAMQSHMVKYRGLSAQLAFLLHYMDIFDQPDWVTMPVSAEAMELALDWIDYLRTHAACIYGYSANREIGAAETLLAKLQDEKTRRLVELPGGGVTSNEVRRKGWKLLTTKKDVDEALETLVEHHWLRVEKNATTERGGRATTRYFLNF